MKTKNAPCLAGCAIPAFLLAAAVPGFCAEPPAAGQKPDTVRPAPEKPFRSSGLKVLYPFDGALFPPEIAAPEFSWEDKNPASDRWLLTLKFSGSDDGMEFFADAMQWSPPDETWEKIKRLSREKKAVFSVTGVSRGAPEKPLSSGKISFSTSKDEVGAQLFYREVPLPFSEAIKDPSRIRWRMGSVSAKETPPIVLEKLPLCGNCHSFSSDGSVLGMDVDYANDKGSYAIVPVREETLLDGEKIITWSDYKREDKEMTFGLLSQVSPDGRYVVSTVKDRSVFVAKPDLGFSQLFFPIKGVLAVYSIEDGTFRALPGADDKDFVQSNPVWSPDGKQVLFARSRAYRLKKMRSEAAALLTEEECEEFLKDGKKFLFDLYRIPFNGGKGGRPEPLKGASGDGLSNFFPKYSPDGKWIVFCKAASYMLLQPDSTLYIIPAGGGKARKMRCNMPVMNSWHSWSPNGRWLVFSSKHGSPYTRLFLTHIDENGNDTPPVMLANFTAADRAANIPEFVGEKGGILKRIRENFISAYSFFRQAFLQFNAGDIEGAIRSCRESLKLDKGNPATHNLLGIIFDASGKNDEAAAHYQAAIRENPGGFRGYTNLGIVMTKRGDLDQAVELYRKAIELAPEEFMAHLMLGNALGMQSQLYEDTSRFSHALKNRLGYSPKHSAGRPEAERRAKLAEAIVHYRKAVELRPDDPATHTELALALEAWGNAGEALLHYKEAVELAPGLAPAHGNLADVLAARGMLEEAVTHYRAALKLEPGVAMLHYNLGLTLEKQGKTAEAARCYREAVKLAPELKEAARNLENALRSGK